MQQLDLLSTAVIPAFDRTFAAVQRHELAHGAWVDVIAGWVIGHDTLFAELERGLQWRSETRKMYGHDVDVPRRLAAVPDVGAGQPLIGEMREALAARYGEDFVRTTAALYRDGSDSVAWHGDTIARELPVAVVATVSLGAPRRFMMRPTDGGASIAFRAGLGTLIVMGGTAQRTWRHAIPKVARAAPRIALMFRPAWAAGYRD